MAQNQANIPSKASGDTLNASELNSINSTVNSNSSDAETRLQDIETQIQSADDRVSVLEDTDVNTIPFYTSGSLPTSGVTNGKVGYNLDTGLVIYFKDGMWFNLRDDIRADLDPYDLDVFLVLGQSNAEGWSNWGGVLSADQNADRANTLMYLGEFTGVPATFVPDVWSPLVPGTNTSWQVSNGFGPEVGFSDEIKSRVDVGTSSTFTKRVAMAKCAYGGLGIANWNSSTGFMYSSTVTFINDLTTKLTNAGYTYNIRGVIWFQGETDASNQTDANAYETNLTNLISDLRTEIGDANLPFVISKVSYTSGNEPAYLTTVRTAQQNVADALTNVGILDSDSYGRQDTVHLSGEGQYQFGEDCVDVMEDAILGNV